MSSTIRGSNLGRGKRVFSSPNRPDRPWSPFSLMFSMHLGSVPGIKWPECEVDHLYPSKTEVTIEGSCTCTATICRNGEIRDSFCVCRDLCHIHAPAILPYGNRFLGPGGYQSLSRHFGEEKNDGSFVISL